MTLQSLRMKNGDVKIKGTNIMLDARENIELTCGGKITLNSAEIHDATMSAI